MERHHTAILGAGAFGFALSVHLDRTHGDRVETRLYDTDRSLLGLLERGEPHPRIAGDLVRPDSARICADLREAVEGVDLAILAVHGQAIPEAIGEIAEALPAEVPLLNVAKALERGSGRRVGEIVADARGEKTPYGILAGGMIAGELARGRRLGATLAMRTKKQAQKMARLLQGPGLYVEASSDVAGVEYAAALKSVLVIGVGMLEGLGCAFGTRTLFLSLAGIEAQALSVALGAKNATFHMDSQCWGNDLLLSAFGSTRNRAFGADLARALSDESRPAPQAQGEGAKDQVVEWRRSVLNEVRGGIEVLRGAVEGIHTAAEVPRLAEAAGIEVPRLAAIATLLEGSIDLADAAEQMLQ